MRLVDSHCHLYMLDHQQDIDNIIRQAKEQGVCHFLNVSVNLADFPQLLETAEAYPCVSASIGIHPNENEETIDLETLLKLGSHPKVIAVGETGLDYFRSSGDLEWQRERFRVHIEASKQLKKPLIIHTRQAREDTLAILRDEKASLTGGVMHCFTEDWETAKQALEMGFYISFSGIVTFKSAVDLQAVAKKVPMDRMLVETDAPYLAPNPHRGKQNEPAYVRLTAEFIASLRGMDPDEFAEQTTINFFDLFKGASQPHV